MAQAERHVVPAAPHKVDDLDTTEAGLDPKAHEVYDALGLRKVSTDPPLCLGDVSTDASSNPCRYPRSFEHVGEVSASLGCSGCKRRKAPKAPHHT